ncbi:MAG: serine/threonine-protein phosphatase [Ruminiclostridium sp.]|nr:serine/threonine-protein phosphatase [Ruminiclostridium sp.]
MSNSRSVTVKKKIKRSLTSRTTRSTVIGCIILGLVAEIIGLTLYFIAITGQYVRQASDTSRHAEMAVVQTIDTIGLSNKVMSIYRGLTGDELAENGSEEYRSRFDEAKNSEEYNALLEMLDKYIHTDNVDDVYVAMYDRKTCAMVYIADPDPDAGNRLMPGDWESVTEAGMNKFLDWNGEGMLYDIDQTEKYGWLCTAGTPIRDESGEICAFLLVDVAPSNIAGSLIMFALQTGIAIVVVTTLIALFQVKHMRKTIVEPIDAIAESAARYAVDKQSSADVSSHFSSLDIHTGDEIENLVHIMSDMELDLAEHEERITKITAEKERIGAELHMATLIQRSILPHNFPAFPDRTEFDLYASMCSAREVGGDFYDFFLIDDDHLGLVMADVSGKGVPAALFMMVSKVILQSCAMLGQSVGETLTKTNDAICSNNQVEMFVTVWFGILEISTGKLTAANAGHEFPALRRADGEFELLEDEHGFVIGGIAGLKYSEYELFLKPGDKLFLYTDGVPEATDAGEELFGNERMLDALNKDVSASPEKILEEVTQSVNAFVNDAEQFDDMTMMCLEYKGR